MSERTEVWESPGSEPGQPAESGQLSETRVLPSVDAPPVDDAAADTVAVDVGPDVTGVDTVMVVTRPAGSSPADTVAVGTVAAETAWLQEQPKVREPVPTGASEPGSAAAPSAPLPFPLDVTAALVGEYRWLEHALHALLGRWVGDAPLAAVKVHLDAQSMRHAWHAELWADRLPVLSRNNNDRLTVPSPPAAALFRMLGASIPRTVAVVGDASPAAPGGNTGETALELPGTLPRLAGLYRVVLPRLVVSYERHLAATALPTDGPIIRALRLVLNDEIEDWRAGEQLIERLVTRPHDVAAVVDYQLRLESALVGAGGRSGLVRIPDSVTRG